MFWCMGFLYTSLLALIFQKLLLPQLPGLHAGNGLLQNDAVFFHNWARAAAEQINAHGWSHWRLFPNAAGNVGILSAVYAVFGPDPAYFIPITAAAHTTGGLLIYLIGQRLWPGRTGHLGGLVAGILFLIFPSALQWYGQNHKDSFAIAGILSMLLAWVSVFEVNRSKKIILSFVLMAAGTILLAVVRPYYPTLTFVSFGVSWCLLLIVSILRGSIRRDSRSFIIACGLLAIIFGVAKLSSHNEKAGGVYSETKFSEDGSVKNSSLQGESLLWKRSSILPQSVDLNLEKISIFRSHFIAFGQSVRAGSAIDADRAPDSAASLMAYLPRALVVGLLAPFPNTWTDKVSPQRLVGAVETLIWYLVASGIIVLLVKRPSRPLFAGLIFVCSLITVLSYAHPNVGSLYRQRFGIWFFVLLCGAIGWSHVVYKFLSPEALSSPKHEMQKTSQVEVQSKNQRGILAASGAIVLMVTLC